MSAKREIWSTVLCMVLRLYHLNTKSYHIIMFTRWGDLLDCVVYGVEVLLLVISFEHGVIMLMFHTQYLNLNIKGEQQ